VERSWYVRRLDASWIRNRYKDYRLRAGWRLIIQLDNGCDEQLDLVVRDDYPRSLPKVGIPHGRMALKWPHANEDNTLCVIPTHEAETLDSRLPATALLDLMARSRELIQGLRAGALEDDFVAEWDTYWNLASANLAGVFSVIEPIPPTRKICFTELPEGIFVGELAGKRDLRQWIGKYLDGRKLSKELSDGLFLWLSAPLLPKSFPSCFDDIKRLISSADPGDPWPPADGLPLPFVLVIGFDTGHGPAVGAIRLSKREQRLKTGHTRLLPGAPVVSRRSVQRADGPWIHTRGGEGNLSLAEKNVVLIGCGSVGGPVAHLLAQSGVGKLTLIDPDRLSWDNVGRFPDGGRHAIGKGKAHVLASNLVSRLPHLEVETRAQKWQAIWNHEKTLLTTADLIVSSVASWNEESFLNEVWLKNRVLPSLLFGWTEAHAAGGHAISIQRRGGCLACRMTNTGLPSEPVVDWDKAGEMRRQAPGCGALYSPYGPVELAPIHGMIGAAALDILGGKVLRSEHRVWVGDHQRVSVLGGKWSETWKEAADEGNKILNRPWIRRSDCPACGRQ